MASSLVLDNEKYRQYLFTKHHVVPGTQSGSFEQVIDSVVGVHSARLPTPYVAFQARLATMVPSDYRLATNLSNRLIKLRCMRKTLHTVTQNLAPIVHIATLELRTSELQSKLKRFGFSIAAASEFLEDIIEVALESPQHYLGFLKYLVDCVRKRKPNISERNSISVARLLLKWLWENGRICYINQAKHWSREIRLFGNIRTLYPNLMLNSLEREDAVRELVSKYVNAFGPVSEKDISWWSGIRITEIRELLNFLKPSLVTVNLKDVSNQLIMTKNDFQRYCQFSGGANSDLWCAFLAYEDPTLKGYFNTRSRYVDSSNYNELFNQIGEVRPSILINGRTVGVWAWNKKTKRVSVKMFRSLTTREQAIVLERKCKLEEFLDEGSQISLNLPGLFTDLDG